ncbi:class I SAM-dependent methyltransferase [Streptomyces sp. ET3-23]|uniref:class I SAM-dependent methyltransferase n=1 Tax=Streptomyces sp. ET3-23 TaxID=2885643 RepID=UPI001D11DD27|nr:class I SAM-dependent methyltransferase [Streptomyces sp. ET3-23]MCC2280556.1 class I SAM-dependent methyltransferase [Streptomyces sp. ET3-23]
MTIDNIDNPAVYWGQLWKSGRRYSPLTDAETMLLDQHAGPGRGRPALDIGCGDGTLARRLAELGYQTTGLDCTPAAPALAEPNTEPVRYCCADIEATQPPPLPQRAYTLITARLLVAFIRDKPAFLRRVRSLLAPGGLFWMVTPMAESLPTERASIGITSADEELLTSLWATARTTDVGSLRCYALRAWGTETETRAH